MKACRYRRAWILLSEPEVTLAASLRLLPPTSPLPPALASLALWSYVAPTSAGDATLPVAPLQSLAQKQRALASFPQEPPMNSPFANAQSGRCDGLVRVPSYSCASVAQKSDGQPIGHSSIDSSDGLLELSSLTGHSPSPIQWVQHVQLVQQIQRIHWTPWNDASPLEAARTVATCESVADRSY